jgi:restriction system protein
VAKKRGFLAEVMHQSQVSAQQRQRAVMASAKAQAAAEREMERAQKAAQRAQLQAFRGSEVDRKAAEKEAQRLHVEAMQSVAQASNAELAAQLDEIDSMLSASLAVDDFVELEELRSHASHPPFDRGDLELSTPMPAPIVGPPEPVWVEPEGSKGLFGKKKHAEEVAQQRATFEQQHVSWQAEMALIPARQAEAMQGHQARERERVANLESERARYAAECQQRENQANEANAALDALIGGLAQNREDAIQDYVGIVMSNSVYPDCFPVDHDHTFDSLMRELTATITVPPPSAVPTVKEYKYNKAKDEVAASAATAKECKDRYANAIAQVAVRTIHEVFESDRVGRIQTIAVTVGTTAVNPATGLNGFVPFVAAAADRTSFMQFDLSHAVPSATLQHLGAVISKNPFDLVAIDMSKGVRGR